MLRDLLGAHRQCILQACISFMDQIILQRQGIGNADARKGQAFLTLEKRNVVGLAECERMFAAF